MRPSLNKVEGKNQLVEVVLTLTHTDILCCLILLSLYNSPSCPGPHFVDQAVLQLTEIRLPLPP